MTKIDPRLPPAPVSALPEADVRIYALPPLDSRADQSFGASGARRAVFPHVRRRVDCSIQGNVQDSCSVLRPAMGDTSQIEWTDATWNPVTGCTKISPGCNHCYAETFAERFRGVPGHPYEQGFDLKMWPERLEYPLQWRKPRRSFVNEMSDLFREDVL